MFGRSVIFMLAISFVMTSFGCAGHDVIYVPDDYAKIQWAIDNASSGDIIILRDGVYIENVNVTKSLTILSENGSENCIIRAANPAYHALQILADHVNIYGLTVVGAKACVAPWPAGIHLEGAKHCIIAYNSVMFNHDGIELDSSPKNIIKNNKVFFNRENGIEIDPISYDTLIVNNTISGGRCELFLYSSPNCTLINNSIKNSPPFDHHGSFGVYGYKLADYIHNIDTSNKVHGKPIYYWINKKDTIVPSNAGFVGLVNCKNITVKKMTLSNDSEGLLLVKSDNSKIEFVNLSYNHVGTFLYFSSGNKILFTHFSNNRRFGIFLNNSNNNTIFLNNFINNIYNVYSIKSNNIWNSTEKITYTYKGSTFTNYMGNYWDDYTGIDANGDGIGDTPYIIDSHNIDYYPLIKPYEFYGIVNSSYF